jgi:L-iditol 2-dehydrogenase
MKSLSLHRIGELQLQESVPGDPEPGDVLLRTTHCSLCRTDAKMWQQGHRDLVLPRVLGHEICGVLTESGDRFVVWPGTSCGLCDACRGGRQNLCPAMRILGFHRDGGLAEFVRVPRSGLIPVPATLPGHVASLAEPLACALNAMDRVVPAPGETVLILGAGPVGLMMALAVRANGAVPIIVDPNGVKLDKSRMFRLKTGIEASVSAGRGTFDVLVNATPSLSALTDGVPLVRSGGRFCLFSGLSGAESVPAALLNELHYREIQVCGAYGCTQDQMHRAVSILDAHREAVEWLIEERISLDQVQDAISSILTGRVLKYVVEFEGC